MYFVPWQYHPPAYGVEQEMWKDLLTTETARREQAEDDIRKRHVYETPGTHTACVKVVDIFGSDTSITVQVPND